MEQLESMPFMESMEFHVHVPYTTLKNKHRDFRRLFHTLIRIQKVVLGALYCFSCYFLRQKTFGGNAHVKHLSYLENKTRPESQKEELKESVNCMKGLYKV